MKRWVIRANGSTVGYEYESLQEAQRRAKDFEEQCSNEKRPWYPVMVVIEQVLDNDGEWYSTSWNI